MKKLARTAWTLQFLMLPLSLLGAVPAISQESTPNLSGIWRWNPDKSHVSGRPASNRRVKIEQQGSDLTISFRVASEMGDEIHKFHYTIGSDDNTNQMMGANLNSKVQWQGGALSVESVAKRDEGEFHISETWTLSPDGQTLTYHASRAMGDRPPREDTIVYEKQPETDWEPPAPPKLAKDVYKNIQILKGMPADNLMSAMQSFARSLGVQCNFCHVMGAFEKDDKPEKQTARKMLMMAHQINADNFGGHMRVTCWTCHRGSAEPASAPN